MALIYLPFRILEVGKSICIYLALRMHQHRTCPKCSTQYSCTCGSAPHSNISRRPLFRGELKDLTDSQREGKRVCRCTVAPNSEQSSVHGAGQAATFFLPHNSFHHSSEPLIKVPQESKSNGDKRLNRLSTKGWPRFRVAEAGGVGPT